MVATPMITFLSKINLSWYEVDGGLWLVDFLKLQVFFAKEPYKRDYILQRSKINLSWS